MGEEALLSGGVHVLGEVVCCSQHNVSLKGCVVYTPVCVLSAEASGPIGTVLPRRQLPVCKHVQWFLL